jgi:hypothetical protein
LSFSKKTEIHPEGTPERTKAVIEPVYHHNTQPEDLQNRN